MGRPCSDQRGLFGAWAPIPGSYRGATPVNTWDRNQVFTGSAAQARSGILSGREGP
jgi:hypothetical protein